MLSNMFKAYRCVDVSLNSGLLRSGRIPSLFFLDWTLFERLPYSDYSKGAPKFSLSSSEELLSLISSSLDDCISFF